MAPADAGGPTITLDYRLEYGCIRAVSSTGGVIIVPVEYRWLIMDGQMGMAHAINDFVCPHYRYLQGRCLTC